MPDLPDPPAIAGVTWRPATEADAVAIVALQDACFDVDRTFRESESEILDRFRDTSIDPASDSLLAVTPNGRVIASLWSIVPGTTGTKWRAFEETYVHPGHRTEGMRDFALRWWEARSAQRLAALDTTLPKVLWFTTYAHRTDMIDWLERRGYAIARYYDELVRDLSRPIDDKRLPTGIRVIHAEEAAPGDEVRAHNQAFADHWGSQPFSEERWNHFKNEYYLPGASYVAYDGDTPVGHVMSASWPHDFADRGFRHSWILSLGVVPGHRGRGLASALITLAMRDFIADGMEYAMLDVDSANPTGAYGLYESLGFTPVEGRRTVAMLKEI